MLVRRGPNRALDSDKESRIEHAERLGCEAGYCGQDYCQEDNSAWSSAEILAWLSGWRKGTESRRTELASEWQVAPDSSWLEHIRLVERPQPQREVAPFLESKRRA